MSRVYLLSVAVLLACARAFADPMENPARVTDDENDFTVVTGELGSPLYVACLKSEDPTLFVFWYRGHGKGKLLNYDAVYGMKRNALLIKSLAIDTLGPYTCQAYNSEDMKPPRMFVVQAYMSDGTSSPASDWLVPRVTVGPSLGTQSPTSAETSTTPLTTTEFSELNDEPEVVAFVGGTAILRPLSSERAETWMYNSTSPSKIWWNFGEIEIDGNAGRYRLLPDGALQIVSLYHNDTGIYTFNVLNEYEEIREQVHLVVNDPVRMPAEIAGDEDAVVTGEIGSPLQVRCLAHGYPPPCVFWNSGFDEEAMVLFNDTNYETKANVLTIKSLNQDTLGEYTCRAYNGVGQVATWKVIVRTNMSEESLVTKNDSPEPETQSSTTVETIITGLLFNETSTAGGLSETTEAFESDTKAHSTINEGTPDVISTTTAGPCNSFEFGCCADNETEAKGSEKEGCPETNLVEKPAGVTDDENASTVVTGELGSPLRVLCLESEDPSLFVFWYRGHGKGKLLNYDAVYGMRRNALLIRSLAIDTLGPYTCQAYNSEDMKPPRTFVVRAYMPDETNSPTSGWLVPRVTVGPSLGTQPPTSAKTSTTTMTTTEASELNGRENERRPVSCIISAYGCCQDGNYPAHGPDFEGCCLLQTFGCCPDNYKPAKGPHSEGCGCQNTLHGCCPDNISVAQGPNNHGCGCQYTGHGCCPDRHTAASGPNYKGCACNTYQFGCCADGVTTAKGPEQQDCHCRDSKLGCCGDGETPATGPDGAGCDCSSSQHGCCPDGRTEATGAKFLGCTDAPENKQAACSMSTDPGHCHNFSAMWYYDLVYGGCSRFWYGGCDGNGNRFSTKEECEDVCVQPSPKDACKLPSVKGPCDTDFQRWHYNSTREQCIPFRYGGCLGNANNFDTRELCQKQCEPSSVAGQCNLPIDQGSCAGNYNRWGFNSEAHRCEQFIWGGCEGNSNRFSSEAACQMSCAGTQPPQCKQPQEAGNCTEKEALWSFSQSENRCLPFYYSGCGGNDNRFSSREACAQTCPSAYVADKCTLPAETGQCSSYRERWFYDTTFKRCRQFYYGGCGGNENNFATAAECENSCSEIKTTTTTTTTTTTARPVEPEPERPHVTDQRPVAPDRSDVPAKPLELPQPEPEVSASEGGLATLRCLFHGNPPPKITWTFGEITVNGNAGRYRLLFDGALQIVSLYRNDTGVYICVADNGLGVAKQEIHLVVNDPVEMPAGIAGDEDAMVTGELGSPFEVRCLAYGYPSPTVYWYRGYEGTLVPYDNAVYEARGNILLVRSLAIETLGQYTCQAYNGVGRAMSWVVFVRAYRPEGYFIENELLVPRDSLLPRPRTRPPTTTEAPTPLFTVPVSTHVSTPFSTLNVGTDLHLTCEVDGWPEPDVHWTKDGATIHKGDRISITSSTIVSRLTVAQVSVADSGLYACHASNQYSSQSDTAQINVQQIVLPAKCRDNPFFPDCGLIVRSKFCKQSHYSKFCCKSCVEAGQIDPEEALQADQPYTKK